MEENDGYIDLPEEYDRRKLNALYREIPLTDAKSRLLRKYFDAAAILYGIIPLEKLYEIIVSQNKNPVTEDEFRAFAEIARHECGWYFVLGDHELFIEGEKTDLMKYYVVELSLIGDDTEEFYDIFEAQQGKPYYIPPKKELLAYAEAGYYEPTKQATEMINFLRDRVGLNETDTEWAFVYICCGMQMMSDELMDAWEMLAESGTRLNERDLQTFTKLYMNLNNNIRMQCNRGYTPSELYAMNPRDITHRISETIKNVIAVDAMDADDMREQLSQMDFPNEELRSVILSQLDEAAKDKNAGQNKKVGRNDPCPCGSGKKYKNCCGR